MNKYEEIANQCVKWIREWFEVNGKNCNAIVGLSGGKDSTIVAALCVKALGADRVIGVAMPASNQGLNDADKIAEHLGITFIVAPIGEICGEFSKVPHHFSWSVQSIQNIPPRIRMTMLYAIAQTFNGRVSCNCNLSEDWVGYSTLFGDSVGSFAPLAKLTVTEVKEVGRALGLPSIWVDKTPDDGLPASMSDEQKFGFTYDTLDHYIRTGICENEAVKEKIDSMNKKNLFKLDIIKVPTFIPDESLWQ